MKRILSLSFALVFTLALVVFVGCQNDTLTEVGPSPEGLSLSPTDLAELIDEYITSEDEAIIITRQGSSEDFEGASITGELPGGIRFGQFVGREAGLIGFALGLGKAGPDPDCSMPVGGGLRDLKKFGRCIMEHIEACGTGGTIHIDSGEVHYHDSC